MVDNAPCPFQTIEYAIYVQTCEALGIAAGFRRGLRCFEYIRKAFQKHTPSVIKQSGSKCSKEAFFHPTRCPFRVLGIIAWRLNPQRLILCLAASQAAWNSLYKSLEGKRRLMLRYLLYIIH